MTKVLSLRDLQREVTVEGDSLEKQRLEHIEAIRLIDTKISDNKVQVKKILEIEQEESRLRGSRVLSGGDIEILIQNRIDSLGFECTGFQAVYIENLAISTSGKRLFKEKGIITLHEASKFTREMLKNIRGIGDGILSTLECNFRDAGIWYLEESKFLLVLDKDIGLLNISDDLKERLRSKNINTVKDFINISEYHLLNLWNFSHDEVTHLEEELLQIKIIISD